MLKDIYVFANTGKMNELPKSGGQTSARRVIQGLEQLGYSVHTIIKHRSEWKGRLAHVVEILLFAFIDLVKITLRLMFKRRKGSTFMMFTYAGSLVPLEFLITAVVRCLGHKSTYYLKGGKLLDTYPTGSRLHKWMFKKIMDWQSLVLFEGMESLEIVKGITSTPLVYFPNYVADCQLGLYKEKPQSPIGILYFGRVTPVKNVHVSIEAYHLLCEKYPDMRLTIIGGSTREVEYARQIDQMVAESPKRQQITRLGNSSFEVLTEAMKKCHFFIFPSQEAAEGQSNSLTEAMTQGLIPVVSDWHFNKTVVGNDKLVVKGYAPADYAKTIDTIIQSGKMDTYARQARERIKDFYTESVVLSRIDAELKKVFV